MLLLLFLDCPGAAGAEQTVAGAGEIWAEPYYYWLVQRGVMEPEASLSGFVSRKQLLVILLKETGLEKRAVFLFSKSTAEKESLEKEDAAPALRWEFFFKTAAETGILADIAAGTEAEKELSPSNPWWEEPAERGWAVKVFLSSLAGEKKKNFLPIIHETEALSQANSQTNKLFETEKIHKEWLPWAEAAFRAGIVNGYPDSLFRAEKPITVAELAVLIGKIHRSLGSGSLAAEGKISAVFPEGDGFKVEVITPEGKKYSFWAAEWVPVWGKEKTGLASLLPGNEAEILLHNNREVAAVKLKLAGASAAPPSGASDFMPEDVFGFREEDAWQDVGDILVVECCPVSELDPSFAADSASAVSAFSARAGISEKADKVAGAAGKTSSDEFLYHNLYPFYVPLTVAYDGVRYWAGDLLANEIYLFDSEKVHRQTIELFPWLRGDLLLSRNGEIWLVNTKTSQAYRLKPVFSEKESFLLASPAISPVPPADGKSLSPPSYCLLYVGGAGKEKILRYGKEDLFPIVAYQDREGAVKDFFFDGFVMLAQYSPLLSGRPFSADLPESKNSAAESEDWKALFGEYFAPGFNLSALEEAVGKAAAVLNRPAYKAKVFLGIPTPLPLASMEKFSSPAFLPETDIPKEISEKNLDTPQVHIVWQAMQEVKQRFEKAGFRHLTLSGFYYQTEQGLPQDEVQKAFPLLCKALGLRSMAIPGVTSSFPLWFCQAGFDIVLLQSSHVFVEEPPRSPRHHLQLALLAAEESFAGVMIETPFAYSLDSSRQKFAESLALLRHPLYRCRPRGCFQSFDILRQWANSPLPEIRELYDQLYRSLKQ